MIEPIPSPARYRFTQHPSRLCALALLGVALLFFGHFMFGRLPVSTDMSLMYAPFYSLRWNGGPPLWNPHLAGGMSMTGNLQFSAWYPPRWPFYFLSDWRSYFSAFMFLHYLITLAGTWGALRAMGFSRASALAGTILFGCGGYMVARIINTTIFLATCWFPWLMWGAVRNRQTTNLRDGWPAMLGMAMIILAGSPHLMIYGSIGFAVAWIAFSVPIPASSANRESGSSNRVRRLLSFFGAWLWLAAGVLIGLPSLIPGLIQVKQSIRTLTDMNNNLADSLRWNEIPFILLGGLGGAMVPEVNDKCVYVGGAGLLLVLLGCLHAPLWRDRRWWCGWALTVTGLVLALGRNIGWQFIMPWIPGLKLLEGPARALALTAFGLALLVALALETLPAISRVRRFVAAAAAVSILIALTLWIGWPQVPASAACQAWLQVPSAVIGRPFAVLDGWMTLALAAISICAWPRIRPGLSWLLITLVTAQLLHFSPRVRPHTEPRDYFNPPANVRFLMNRGDKTDFRIAAMDPLQAHDVEWDNLHKFKFLMPNTATLYGLNDIRGFDPLIPLDYYNAFKAAAGTAPYNDPIRNLELGRPDEALFARLNVRYYIGHPGDRRVTHLPLLLSPQKPVLEITSWNELGITDFVEAWQCVSLVDGPNIPPHGTPLARLIVTGADGEFAIPIHYGLETAHVLDRRELPENPNLHVNMRWSVYSPDPKEEFHRIQQNYRTILRFPKPARIRSVRWELLTTDSILYVSAQACRLDSASLAGKWNLVYDDPVAPVYQFIAHETPEKSNPGPPTHN